MYIRILVAAIAIAGYLISSPHPLLGQGKFTISVRQTFDYPGSGNATVEGINDRGDVVGYFEDATGAIRGFTRFADGTFSDPIVEPNDTGNLTVAKDINNSGDVVGYYFSSDIFFPYRGFLLANTTFTEYGPGGFDFYINGINDAGDFCATLDFHYLIEGLLQLAAGGQIVFQVGNSAHANAINALAEIVGHFDNGQGGADGYIRVEFPIPLIRSPVNYPGATATFLLGLNDSGRVIVGKYLDRVGATRGLVLQRPTLTFSSFDYPGAIETSLNAINNHKIVAGYYADSSGIHHAFIGRIIVSR